MPGSTKGHKQGDWDEMSMKNAVFAVMLNGMSKKKAAKIHNVPRQTLQRHINKAKLGLGVEKRLGRRATLTDELEQELSENLQSMEGQLYGLTPMDVRRVVFDFCKTNNVENCFNTNKEIAGRKWFKLFMKRHKELSIRSPEPTSIQRAQGFNKPKVMQFYSILKTVLFAEDGTRRVPPENIYNADETGFSICHKPQKVLAKRGKRYVGAITSAERGRNTTVLCCVSAVGHYVPPFILFPRVHMKSSLMDGAPPGSMGKANKSGWMTEEMFTVWFDHFLDTVKPVSRTEPVVLLVDGHSSHTRNLTVLDKARANNVTILIFPSHCTHRLQPCDVSFFKSLKWNYDNKAQSWMVNHSGRAITEPDMVSIFTQAYGKSATVGNAISGFKKTGIHPFDPTVLNDEDFAAASVTDNDPVVSSANEGVEQSSVVPGGVDYADQQSIRVMQQLIQDVIVNDSIASTSSGPVSNCLFVASSTDSPITNCPPLDECLEINHPAGDVLRSTESSLPVAKIVVENAADSSVSDGSRRRTSLLSRAPASFSDLIGTPKRPRKQSTSVNIGRRRVGHSEVLTASPYKAFLEQSASERKKITVAKKKSVKECGAGVKQMTKTKEPKDGPISKVAQTDNTPCMVCEIRHCDSKVQWFKCKNCQQWACGDCAHIGRKKAYVCDSCK